MRNKNPFLSAEDEALWKESQKNVAPLENRPEIKLPKNTRIKVVLDKSKGVGFLLGEEAPAQTQLTRRDVKKIAKGGMVIDGKLDLHGSTKEMSFKRLLSFIENGSVKGKKCLLVVTGKGGKRFPQTKSTPIAQRKYDDFNHGGGVLKNAVPLWLSVSPFNHYVASFHEAHLTHGGGGAFYVMLRRVKPR